MTSSCQVTNSNTTRSQHKKRVSSSTALRVCVARPALRDETRNTGATQLNVANVEFANTQQIPYFLTQKSAFTACCL